MKRLIGLFIACWLSSSWAAWPVLPYPRGAKVEAIGENVRLNGVPMRMHRVLSTENTESILNFYRGALGEEVAETRVRHQQGGGLKTHILTQLKGDYLITVRVTQMGANVTEALLAISDGRESQSTRDLPLGFSLPADSQLLSDMESVDAGKNSRQLVFSNKASLAANESFVIDMLSNKGYRLQSELTQSKAGSVHMLFVGREREAMVVVNKVEGKTSVVMTTISSEKLAEQ